METISRQPTAKNTTTISTFKKPVGLALGRKQFLEESDRPNLLQRPDDPAGEEDQRHGERQVEIGIRAAEQRFIDHETVGGLMSPPDGADPGNEARPSSRTE